MRTPTWGLPQSSMAARPLGLLVRESSPFLPGSGVAGLVAVALGRQFGGSGSQSLL